MKYLLLITLFFGQFFNALAQDDSEVDLVKLQQETKSASIKFKQQLSAIEYNSDFEKSTSISFRVDTFLVEDFLLRRLEIDFSTMAMADAYYQAARIDGASRFAVFRFIQLPKLRNVLMIAVLLRFMDSFMIYTEPFVLTGGGPGNATTFLSQYLTQKAVGQFDLGPAAAFSLIYFLIILLFSFILYNWMQRVGTGDQA